MKRFLTFDEWKKPPSIKNSKSILLTIPYKIESLTIEKFHEQLDSVFSYLYKFMLNNEIDVEIFGLSMTLFHYYTYHKCFRNFDKYKLIISCIFLSAKIKGSFFYIEKLQNLHKKYKRIDITEISDKEIIIFELEIMNFLGYELEIETPYRYISSFLKNKNMNHLKNICLKSICNKNINFLKSEYSDDAMRSLCFNIINDCYRRSFCIVFRADIIALVAFTISLSFLNNLTENEKTEIDLNEVKEIYSNFYTTNDNLDDFCKCLDEIVMLISNKFKGGKN